MSYDGSGRYHHAATVSAGTSDPLVVATLLPGPAPINGAWLTVSLTPNGTSAKVQHTISTLEAVEADTAQWYDWGAGTVTTGTMDALLAPVTALRVVSTGGTASWEVRG